MRKPVKSGVAVERSQTLTRRRSWASTGLICVGLLSLAGCSRAFWRQNADDNTYAALQDKLADPRWSPPRYDLQPHPHSRIFNPYDPDCEPLPPDDPAAHNYMHWMGRNINVGFARVDQPWHGGVLPAIFQPVKPIKGWKSWHQFGESLSVENPQWMEQFGLTVEQEAEQVASGAPPGPGVADLTLEQAQELAYIHSREFQTQLENLYLTALDLTFERFRFDVRYLGLGGGKPSASLLATELPERDDNISTNTRIGVSKLLPTGGQWAVEFANNTLWLFGGGNQSATASTLSYSLVQPLLLGAGRQVALESLTQSERNALYAARDFARFRQTFFVNIVSGGGGSNGGYLSLLRQQQVIRNQQGNIALLEEQVERLRALATERPDEMAEKLPKNQLPGDFQIPAEFQEVLRYDAELEELRFRGLMTQADYDQLKLISEDVEFQAVLAELLNRSLSTDTLTLNVTQLETQLASNRSSLLNSVRTYQDALDRYKLQLGLPPDLYMTVDLSMLSPFELRSEPLKTLERELTDFVVRIGDIPDVNPPVEDLQNVLRELQVYIERIDQEGFGLIDSDMKRVMENTPRRLEQIGNDPDRQRYLDFLERDQRLIDRAKVDLLLYRTTLQKAGEKLTPQQAPNPENKAPAGAAGAVPERRVEVRGQLIDLREKLLQLVQGLLVVQINLRVEVLDLNEFDIPMEQAVQTALENRVDLMNQRAIVMDARRQIEVIANQLRSQLDLRFEGEVQTLPLGAGSQAPLEFRRDQSSFRAGIGFTTPLDQVRERNAYRESLINYQRARRAYMQFEDQLKIEIRQEWRQLNVLKQTFEISRLNLRLAAMQYDQSVEQTTAPATATTGGGSQSQNTGLNLLNALNSVLQAQNNLIQIWADYETNRLNIHRDMGIMQIDERGTWLDPYYQQRLDNAVNSVPAQPVLVPPAPDEPAQP